MDLTTESSAKEILDPYLDIISQIYREALEDLTKAKSATTQIFNKRSQSTLLHNFAMNLAKKYLSDESGIHILEKYSSIQIIFSADSPLVARFKKINKENVSSNISTNRSNSINNQLSLWPSLNVTYIEFGYRMNKTNTDYETLAVVCRIGNEIVWTFDLDDGIETTTTVSTDPVTPSPHPEKQIKVIKENEQKD